MISILPIFDSNKALNLVIALIGLWQEKDGWKLDDAKTLWFGRRLFRCLFVHNESFQKQIYFTKCLIWFQSRWGPASEMRLAHTRKGVGQPFFIIFNYPQFLMTGIKLKYLFAMTYAWYSKRSREFRRAVSTWVSLKFR